MIGVLALFCLIWAARNDREDRPIFYIPMAVLGYGGALPLVLPHPPFT